MGWESIDSRGRGASGYGPDWNTVPAVSIGKTGVTFNAPCMETFGLQQGAYIRLLFDRDRRVLAFKRCINGEDLIGAYKVSSNWKQKKGRRGGRNGHIHTPEIAKRAADCIGNAFRAQLNAGEHVVEVALSTTNRL